METLEQESTETQPQKSPRIARIGDRVFALFLDFVVLLPIYFLAGCILAIWFGNYSTGSFELRGGPFFLYLLVTTAVWVIYYAICEANFRKTIGKWIVGIEIRPAGPLPFSAEQAWRRNLLRPIDAIGFYLLGFLVANSSKRNQTIGDKVANTIVYEEERPNREEAVWAGIAFLLGGIALNIIFGFFAVPVNR